MKGSTTRTSRTDTDKAWTNHSQSGDPRHPAHSAANQDTRTQTRPGQGPDEATKLFGGTMGGHSPARVTAGGHQEDKKRPHILHRIHERQRTTGVQHPATDLYKYLFHKDTGFASVAGGHQNKQENTGFTNAARTAGNTTGGQEEDNKRTTPGHKVVGGAARDWPMSL